MRNLMAGLAFAALLTGPVWADKKLPDPERKVVGDAVEWQLVPTLSDAARGTDGKRVWTDHV
ncbi:MAG: hypothetical protein AAFU65_07240, partial [Pseudomonadota bacterium]